MCEKDNDCHDVFLNGRHWSAARDAQPTLHTDRDVARTMTRTNGIAYCVLP
jgi:hypothetical protein